MANIFLKTLILFDNLVQDAVNKAVVEMVNNGGSEFRYSFMIFSSSIFYVTTSGTVSIADSGSTQTVYSSEDIVIDGQMPMKNHIRYLGEGVKMQMALSHARDHFSTHLQSDEEVGKKFLNILFFLLKFSF